MNKIVIAFFIFLINTVLYAEDQNKELDRLFLELKKNIPSKSSNIEQQIWLLWSTHPSDEKLTSLLDEGSRLVQDQKLYKAISIFTDAIELDPTWAEAWNKRATVYYMLGQYDKSMFDIKTTLELEPRHFGAMDGMISIFLKQKKFKSIPLKVSAPFHCSLMKKAAENMKDKIENTTFLKAKPNIISNVTAKEETNENRIKPLLIDQITSRVRWKESVEYMIKNGITNFLEIGPGKVLSGLIKRIVNFTEYSIFPFL